MSVENPFNDGEPQELDYSKVRTRTVEAPVGTQKGYYFDIIVDYREFENRIMDLENRHPVIIYWALSANDLEITVADVKEFPVTIHDEIMAILEDLSR